MAIGKTPDFSRNVANRVLREHGLEGKVTPEQLAEAAKAHDATNPGYISGDEFALAAADLAKTLGGSADVGQAPAAGPTHSILSVRTAQIGPAQADLSDARLAFGKERILANVGPGARFGELNAGEGLQAFTIDAGAMKQLVDGDKLKQVKGQAFFGALTTGDKPQLTLAASDGKKATILSRLDLMDPRTQLPGEGDNLQKAAALFGDAPRIDLGGSQQWKVADWASGDAHKTRDANIAAARDAREAAWAARREAAAEALQGPTTIAAFEAAGVTGHKHTDAEKKALFDLVKKGAGEDATFPNPDDSYYGLHVFLLEGPAAAHAVAFAQANLAGRATFDPDAHSVIVTAKSFDEAQLGTYVVDRASGTVVFGDESNTVDYDGKALSAFFPGPTEEDPMSVVGVIARSGEHLGVVAGSDTPDGMDFTDW